MNVKNFIGLKSSLFENKTIRQTIFKNTFWLAVAEVIQKGVGFLIVVWIARHFGPAIYGQWAFALSFVALFTVLADFGFGTLTVREVARDKSKTSSYIDNIVAMKLILGLIVMGLIALVIQFLGKEPQVIKLVYFLGIYVILNTFGSFFRSIFRANEKMQYETVCRVVQSLSLLGLGAFFILNKGSILTISYAYIGATFIGVLSSLALIWRYFSRFFLKLDFKICKEILKESWPFCLSGVFVTIYFNIDTVMISIIKNDFWTGIYGSVYNIELFINSFLGLVCVALFPRISKDIVNNISKFKKDYKRIIYFLSIISTPFILTTLFYSKDILNFFYGNRFILGSSIFIVLILTLYFSIINNFIGLVIFALNKQKVYMYLLLISIIFNITGNILFINLWGALGAAATTLLSEILIMVLFCDFINKHLVKCSIIKQNVFPISIYATLSFLSYLIFLAYKPHFILYFLIISIFLILVIMYYNRRRGFLSETIKIS